MVKRVALQVVSDAEKEKRRKQLVIQSKKLKRWFRGKKGRRQHDMAEALGVRDFAVHAWCNAERCPSGLYPVAIEKYTGGEVKAEGWPKRPNPSVVQEFLSQ